MTKETEIRTYRIGGDRVTENKSDIVMRLKILLKATRAGSDIEDLILNETKDSITILFCHGGRR
mgnify:CR=1 FL=1